MSGPKGNSEFCSPKGETEGIMRSRGNKTHCFVLLFLPTQKRQEVESTYSRAFLTSLFPLIENVPRYLTTSVENQSYSRAITKVVLFAITGV